MRFGVFRDFRGVLYCEVVNEGLEIYRKEIPARPEKKNWRGKVVQEARAATYHQECRFLEPYYDRKSVHLWEAKEERCSRPEYVQRPDLAYMEPNFWGPVEVLLYIDDVEQGRKMQKLLHQFTPEGNGVVSGAKRSVGNRTRRMNNATPREGTEQFLERITEVAQGGNHG